MIILVHCSILIFKIDKKDPEFVIHAGGGMGNNVYLNCEEGVKEYIEKGCNLIELDFMFTKDNEIICSHLFENLGKYSMTNRPTLQEAIDMKIFNKYSILTFDNLLEILEQNPTVRIIFDTKEEDDNALISKMIEICLSKNFNLKSRMIIQVYDYQNYLEMNEFNFDEYWFTNYKVQYSPQKIKKYFAKAENVTTIVLYDHCWKVYRSVNFSINKKIAVHTVNDKSYVNFLKNRGVDYIYTDFLV